MANLTRIISNIYKDQDLNAITYLNRSDSTEFIKGTNLQTWECFSRLNSKSKGMTLSDLWTRQLLVIKGMSLERASRIVKKYPSCSHLMESIDDPMFDGEVGKKLVQLLTSSSF